MTSVPEPIKTLDRDACWSLMRLADVGRLAVIVDAHPDIFPVNYAVDGGTLVFRTAIGTKFAAAVATPEVAFEVDGYDRDSDEAWSVVVKGRAEVIHGITELLGTNSLPIFPWQPTSKSQFMRINAEQITGRRFRRADKSFWDTPLSGARSQSPE